jgi:rhodanese-related sulfurtransferase
MDVKSDAFITNLSTLDRSKTYLLYCKSARRSATALNLMQQADFKKVKHLKGGIEKWKGKKEQ